VCVCITPQVYVPHLPRHMHAWVYIAITLPPESVDANVHPTKREVSVSSHTPYTVHTTFAVESIGAVPSKADQEPIARSRGDCHASANKQTNR
jgi:DNA mismatch repair ATPase MutL